tara:strand:- start:38368 stop:38823 length:456 start_codon:yes stop_codon:yes gene_type:complete
MGSYKYYHIGAYLEVHTKPFQTYFNKKYCRDCDTSSDGYKEYCSDCGTKIEKKVVSEIITHTLCTLFGDEFEDRLASEGKYGTGTLLLRSNVGKNTEYDADQDVPQRIEPSNIDFMKKDFRDTHKEEIEYLQNHDDVISVKLHFGFFYYYN